MAILYNKNYGDTTPFSDVCAQVNLIAGVELSYTVPGNNLNNYQVSFKYPSESSIYVGLNVTAALPGSNSLTTDQYVEFKPGEKYAKGGDVLSFISSDSTVYFGFSLMQLSQV